MRHEKAGSLLELARHLAASAEGMTLDEMANAAGVGRRTAERMRDALETLFPQIETVQEGTVKRFRIPKGIDGFFHAPTTEELVELSKSAATLRAAGHAARAEAMETLDRKVRAAMKSATLRRVTTDVEALARAEMTAARAGPRPFDAPELMAKLRHAIMAMCAVRFRYKGGSSPGAWRTVCPYGILFERMNYLVAAEIGSDQPRNWRLDRIGDLELTGTAASPPDTFNLSEYANRSFGIYQDGLEDIVLRVLPAGVEDARAWRFHASQQLHEEQDGSMTVRFRSSGMREVAWHLFTWGDTVEILAPERLKATMLEQLQLCARHHLATKATDIVVPVA